ncbi:MAG: hypothetical protein AB1481_06245, partial [Candidatus Omnitrophota bacterium]
MRIRYLFLNILPFFIIGWVVFVNRFPSGYVFVGGDFFQPVHFKDVFHNFFFVWNNFLVASPEGGLLQTFCAFPYYFIFYFLPTQFGLNDTQILSYIFFLFLCGSYLSFLFTVRSLFKDKKNAGIDMLFSLLYAINFTTFYFFTYTWGFSHHVIIYIFIPVLSGLFVRLIETKNLRYSALFAVFLFFSASAYGSAAFFVALCFYLFLLLLLFAAFKLIKLDVGLMRALFVTSLLSAAVLSYWFLPLLKFVSQGYSAISGGGIYDLKSWLSMQSVGILNIFTMVPSYFSPGNPAFNLIIFLPAIGLGLSLLIPVRESKERKILLIFCAIYLVFVFLVKKLAPPFSTLSYWVFKIPLFTVLRSYEKTAIFLEFTLLIILYIFVTNIRSQKNRRIAVFMLVLILVSPFPFFTGGILTRYSVAFPSRYNYKNATYAHLVKIPDDYYRLAESSNRNQKDTKIQSLPYSVQSSLGWCNYPKWKLIGGDPTADFFRHPIIYQNSPAFLNVDGWNPNDAFNEKNAEPAWFVRMLSLFNVEKIFFHKDVVYRFVGKALPRMDYLVRKGVITKESET